MNTIFGYALCVCILFIINLQTSHTSISSKQEAHGSLMAHIPDSYKTNMPLSLYSRTESIPIKQLVKHMEVTLRKSSTILCAMACSLSSVCCHFVYMIKTGKCFISRFSTETNRPKHIRTVRIYSLKNNLCITREKTQFALRGNPPESGRGKTHTVESSRNHNPRRGNHNITWKTHFTGRGEGQIGRRGKHHFPVRGDIYGKGRNDPQQGGRGKKKGQEQGTLSINGKLLLKGEILFNWTLQKYLMYLGSGKVMSRPKDKCVRHGVGDLHMISRTSLNKRFKSGSKPCKVRSRRARHGLARRFVNKRKLCMHQDDESIFLHIYCLGPLEADRSHCKISIKGNPHFKRN